MRRRFSGSTVDFILCFVSRCLLIYWADSVDHVSSAATSHGCLCPSRWRRWFLCVFFFSGAEACLLWSQLPVAVAFLVFLVLAFHLHRTGNCTPAESPPAPGLLPHGLGTALQGYFSVCPTAKLGLSFAINGKVTELLWLHAKCWK